MTDEQQIRAIAELDGWTRNESLDYLCLDLNTRKDVKRIMWSRSQESCCEDNFQNYLSSRDAIIPVIEKQFNGNNFRKFDSALCVMNHNNWGLDASPFLVLSQTPRQLAEALLRATGKWVE